MLTKLTFLLAAATCLSMLGAALPNPKSVHADGLKVNQIDQAFFRDLEQYRRSAADRRHGATPAPMQTPSELSSVASSTFDRG